MFTYMFACCNLSSEIYSRQRNQLPAKNLLQPECTCSRDSIDSFNILRTAYEETESSSVGQCGSIPRYSPADHSQWSIFTSNGWVSDFTNRAEVRIQISQDMLVSFRFRLVTFFSFSPIIILYMIRFMKFIVFGMAPHYLPDILAS